jgi:hypothetical protein
LAAKNACRKDNGSALESTNLGPTSQSLTSGHQTSSSVSKKKHVNGKESANCSLNKSNSAQSPVRNVHSKSGKEDRCKSSKKSSNKCENDDGKIDSKEGSKKKSKKEKLSKSIGDNSRSSSPAASGSSKSAGKDKSDTKDDGRFHKDALKSKNNESKTKFKLDKNGKEKKDAENDKLSNERINSSESEAEQATDENSQKKKSKESKTKLSKSERSLSKKNSTKKESTDSNGQSSLHGKKKKSKSEQVRPTSFCFMFNLLKHLIVFTFYVCVCYKSCL